jgi:DNA processing protein
MTAGAARGSRSQLPEEAFALALASTASIGPSTLRGLLWSELPSTAWAKRHRPSAGAAGEASDAADAEDTADTAAVEKMWEEHQRLGIAVVLPTSPDYPSRLGGDPHAPGVLFCLGRPAVLKQGPTVALVGTRAPTRYGIGVAAQFGAELSAAGVSVVSGLALGIDGAAHEGACGAGAPPIAVVAGGLDRPYPQRHARLWGRVAEEGAIVSESPAGGRTEKWRFPARNRLLAALSDVVVVVESRHHGGSRHTVDAAAARGIPVGAVPGSIRSAASEGTNALVADGAFPACSVADVLVALSLAGAVLPRPDAGGTTSPRSRRSASAVDELVHLGREQRVVYEALTQDPTSLDELARLSGLGLPALCAALEQLAHAGLAHDAGGWWERA